LLTTEVVGPDDDFGHKIADNHGAIWVDNRKRKVDEITKSVNRGLKICTFWFGKNMMVMNEGWKHEIGFIIIKYGDYE